MCARVGVRECQQARAITRILMDRISVCMTGQLSHNWHRLTGHIRGLGADLGSESCEKPPLVFRSTEAFLHSCTA